METTATGPSVPTDGGATQPTESDATPSTGSPTDTQPTDTDTAPSANSPTDRQPTDSDAPDRPDDARTTTGADGPGFGVLIAIAAILGFGVLTRP